MINVPHEPEMADVYQFRRLFTQSPACPHENTPIGCTPERSKPQGSLDLDFAFHSGSPTAPPRKTASLQKLSAHIKQKLSESRLSKSSSKAEKQDNNAEEEVGQAMNLGLNGEAINFGISARSTALSDLLRSRNGSKDGYDSDAKSIKTPQMESAVGTIRLDPNKAQTSINNAEIQPEDSLSNYHVSPEPAVAVLRMTPQVEGKPRSSPFPGGPDKLSFLEALHLEPDESPGVTLKRLSSGIASGVIRSPSSDELRAWKSLEFQGVGTAFKAPLQTPRRSSSIPREPDTPQTVVKRLSQRIEYEKRTNKRTDDFSSKSTSLLDGLDPALVEYLSRFSSSIDQSKSTSETTSPRTVIRDNNGVAFDHQQDSQIQEAPHITLFEQSPADISSLTSHVPSDEQHSVHLFNMQISQRLASKSTATMLSPTSSGNASKKSLETRVPTAPVLVTVSTPTAHTVSSIRAEHNRRPSDPLTKYLFELPKSGLAPHCATRSISIDQSRRDFGDDDGSSCYTHDGGPPSSAGGTTVRETPATYRKNPNSIAIGGRAASSEIPVRHSSKADNRVSRSQDLQFRRFSVPSKERVYPFDISSGGLSSCGDGNSDISIHQSKSSRGEIDNQSRQFLTRVCQSTVRHPNDDAMESSSIATGIDKNTRAFWLTDGQRSCWKNEFSMAPTPNNRKHSATSAVAPENPTSPSLTTETATNMWNRAFQDFHKDHASKFLLPTPHIEMDHLRRKSSSSTVRSKHRSSVVGRKSTPNIRRSHSAEPHVRKSLSNSDETHQVVKKHKSLRRMSLQYLTSAWPQTLSAAGQRKLQKYNSPRLSKQSSLATPGTRLDNASETRETSPLKELLGIWGSFPSHNRAKRMGPAGENDNVFVRDFGLSEQHSALVGLTHTSPKPDSATSKVHNISGVTLRQPRNLPWKKSKTLSLPILRVRKPSKMLSPGKWQYLYRAKSSELGSRLTHRAYENRLAADLSHTCPELDMPQTREAFSHETAQDRVNGWQAYRQQTSDVITYENQCRNSGQPNEMTTNHQNIVGNGVNLRWKTQSDSSLSEPILYRDIVEQNSECTKTPPQASTRMSSRQQPDQCRSPKTPTTAYRTSKDLKIPGSFKVD